MLEQVYKFASRFGLWALVAIWLLWLFTGKFSADLEVIRDTSEATRAAIVSHQASTDRLEGTLSLLVNLQLQQCVNTADDVVKREHCFSALVATPTREK